jgi:hypothetical protein
MAGAGKKTFTAGETLTASDVNTYLMEQSVMYFAGTAARSSAIPTPSTGMTSYIGVTGTATIPQLETYTGSAWQTPYGLTQVTNVSFTTATTININNCFSASYENYKMIVSITDSAGTGGNIAWQSRNAGTTDTTSNSYSVSGISHAGASVTALNNNAQNTGFIGYSPISSGWGQITADIILPFASEYTTIIYQNSGVTGGGSDGYAGAATLRRTATSHDGITLIFPANTTGNIRIYGYRNN